MFITSFTDFQPGLDEAPKKLKGRALHKWLIRNLRRRRRISWFEITPEVARPLMFLVNNGKVKLDSQKHEYPYVAVEVR